MSVTSEVLFNKPQQEIASIIRDKIAKSHSVSIVSGFITVEGIESIAAPIRTNPSKLSALVVGAGTYRAYDALDRLIGAGVPQNRLFVHLGHSRPTTGGAQHAFYRYHPMLHSKIYLMEMPDGSACAFVGSHNATGFALLGLNGEAAVMLEGPRSAPQFAAIRGHILESQSQAVQYTSGMKEAYSWWTTQFIDGLRAKSNDIPRDGEAKKTIVILSARADDPLPEKDDIIYFEIPSALGRITSLQAEVHIYIFSTSPSNPYAALDSLSQARRSLWCHTRGLELEQGGDELKADWYIQNKTQPKLLRAPRPFRPKPAPDMQQVRVKVRNDVYGQFEYYFESTKASWEPDFDYGTKLQVSQLEQRLLEPLELIPPEDKEWYLVKSLRGADGASTAFEKALEESSPQSGSFILISQRRRNKDETKTKNRRGR